MKLNRKNNKKGFTIVELVIVIAVIGILSAILIPTFTNLTSQAQSAAAKDEVNQAYNAYVIHETQEASETIYTIGQVAIKRNNNWFTYATTGDNKGWVDGGTTKPTNAGTSALYTYSGIEVYENVA